MSAISWTRLSSMGWDGLAMFLLSLITVTATAGLSWVLCWAIVIRFARTKPEMRGEPDVILVLGSRLVNGSLTEEFKTRLECAAQVNKMVPLLIAGGLSRSGMPSEAIAGRDWLAERGLDHRQILMEDGSRNTLENLSRARDLMLQYGFARPLLITSRYHLARCYILARGLGLSPVLCPTEKPGLAAPLSLARTFLEAVMINWYFVGRFWGRMTGNQSIMARLT